MELLKINCGEERGILFRASSYAYAVGVICAFTFGILLDFRPDWWTNLFCIAAMLGLTATYILTRIPYEAKTYNPKKIDLRDSIVHPLESNFCPS